MIACSRRGGFTLLEVTVSMVSASVLIAAMGTALSLAVRSAQVSTPADASADAYFAATAMMNDLQMAKAFTEMQSKQITIVTADRNGDGSDESIHYQWSGTPGQLVTRRVNNGETVTFLPAVENFAVLFTTVNGSVHAAKVVLQISSNASSRIDMLVPLLNRPAALN